MAQDSCNSSEQEPEDSDIESEFVEVDPSGRYGRYKEVLGKGAFKKVYRAFDELEGIEVAWNQVRVSDLLRNTDDMERLYSEVHLLQTLKHKNIIKFYNSWIDNRNDNINFITEIFTSGTLRQYRKKHKNVDLRAVKKWSRQILEGLWYLHSHDPPVIHRDLKCDNIFVNGNQGEVKIGDLGLAAILRQARSAHSVIGTPEFMAPELYEEEYNELVDIYAFGMCLLELVTFEYPYVECANAAQIFKKVTSGIKPASLAKVKDPDVKRFIEKCIAKVSDRVSAKELLVDPFLNSDSDIGRSMSRSSLHMRGGDDTGSLSQSSLHLSRDCHSHPLCGSLGKDLIPEGSRDFTVKGQRKDHNTIFLKLRIADSTGNIRNIHFPFDIEVDTAASVASEMVEELDLTDQDVSAIAAMIDTEIRSYIPDWAPPHEHLSSSYSVDASASASECGTSDVRDETSPMTNDCVSSPTPNLVLERLPSGRKYWSDSPKTLGGSSPAVVGASNMSPFDSTPRDSWIEENDFSPNSKKDTENETDFDENENEHEHEPESPYAPSEENDHSVDLHSTNGAHHFDEKHQNPTSESTYFRIIVQKLEHPLLEQKKEVNEVRKKHELAVSELLKNLTPEMRCKVLSTCNMIVTKDKLNRVASGYDNCRESMYESCRESFSSMQF